MAKVYLKPKDLVRNPKTMEPLPKDGMWVEYNSYWRRRVKDGSCEISKPVKKDVSHEIKREERK